MSKQCDQSPRASHILTSTAIDVLNLVHEDAPAALASLSVERAIDVENQLISLFFQKQFDLHNQLLVIPVGHVEENLDPPNQRHSLFALEREPAARVNGRAERESVLAVVHWKRYRFEKCTSTSEPWRWSGATEDVPVAIAFQWLEIHVGYCGTFVWILHDYEFDDVVEQLRG